MPALASLSFRSALYRWLPATAREARPRRDISRLRLAWIEAASQLVQLEDDLGVRQVMATFLTRELDAASAEFEVETEAGGAPTVGQPVFSLPRLGLRLNVQLRDGATWTAEELDLARRAVETTEGVLIAHAQLRDVQAQSLTDPLTGLLNRRGLASHLSREALLAQRHAQPLSVAAIDVDFFKSLNDTLGHAAGDAALRAIADRMIEALRRTDIVFRLGGDEFVVLLPQTTLAHAVLAMEKVQAANTGPTLSVGVAELKPGESVAELLAAADAALYRAKRANRNCIQTAA